MAELFTTLIAGLGGGGSAAAAGGAAAGAATTGFSLTSLLSTGATVVGGLASMAAGRQQQSALNAQAGQEEIKAVQEEINGRQEALTAMRKLNSDLSNVLVAGYGSGLSPTGSIEAAQNEALQTGEANITMARNNARFASAARRGQAQQLRIEGRGAKNQGLFSAISGGLSLGSRRDQRG
jgi:hypothetical protein